MTQGRINYLAILCVVILHQILGFLWYSPMLFGNRWLMNVGKSMEELKASGATPYIVAIVTVIVMCLVLTKLIHMTQTKTFVDGLKLGFLIWLGIAFPLLSIHYVFAGRTVEFLLIDAGHALAGILIAGGILAQWR